MDRRTIQIFLKGDPADAEAFAEALRKDERVRSARVAVIDEDGTTWWKEEERGGPALPKPGDLVVIHSTGPAHSTEVYTLAGHSVICSRLQLEIEAEDRATVGLRLARPGVVARGTPRPEGGIKAVVRWVEAE
jgi:hypothetical protein